MKIYIVRNKEGKFFRNIGYGGTGQNWQDTLDRAKIYTKIGQAKSRCTYFYKAYPQFGCPDILEFDLNIDNANVINMEEVSGKSIKKAKEIQLKYEKKHKENEIKRLNKDKEELKSKLKELNK